MSSDTSAALFVKLKQPNQQVHEIHSNPVLEMALKYKGSIN